MKKPILNQSERETIVKYPNTTQAGFLKFHIEWCRFKRLVYRVFLKPFFKL